MSTDLPEGNEPQRGTTGRTPRVGDSRSPVGSTLSIILAVIAVVAGFFILRELTDDDGDGATTDQGGTATDDTSSANSQGTTGSDGSTPSAGSADPGGGGSTAPTSPQKTLTGATIAVVNASGVGGSAGTMSSAITTAGYEGVVEPGNTTGEQLSASLVHYVDGDAAAQAVAESLAADLGGVEASAMPEPRPAQGGDTGTATVLVMLGTDAAGQSLADLSGDDATTPPTVAGGATETTGG